MNSLTRSRALKDLLIFAVPIILGQIGIMLIGTGDMIIAGRFSRECLAAVGLAIAIANPIMLTPLGLQFSISPLLAQKRGKGEDISPYFWTVIAYSLMVATISCLLSLASVKLLPWFNYSENITRIIKDYLIITSFSTFTLCLYQGVKEFFQSEEKTMAANIVALVGVGVNLLLNYAFVFGYWGMPQLNEAGLAWASLGVRTFMGVGLFLMAFRLFKTPFKIHKDFMWEVWKLGVPISISLFLEIMAFCSVTLFVGKFAETQTAANNLALNIGSLAFMIPLAISSAVGVKVGHAYGEKSLDKIKIFYQVSLFASFCFTLVTGLLFYLVPDGIMLFFTTDGEVLEWGKKLLFWVACFQLFDGAQVTLAGILRGLNVTRPSTISMFIGYWIIGIPLGYYLGFHGGMEAQGFWIGLALALATVALMLSFVLKYKMKALVKNGL
jgi:multidrug resistance protein, MATE family